MGWTLSLGTMKGTAVRVHWTFLLFLVWIGASLFASGGWAAVWSGLAFLVLLFACVVLHEFGHIFAARRYGIRTPEVLLLPIGGVSRLKKIPEEPRKELIIALAGPAVSLGIALALMVALGGLPAIESIAAEVDDRSLFAQLAYANLFLGLFNLLPAFPMDGGRVLRALLGMRYGHARATRMAAKVGQAAAILFALAAFMLGHVILMFIALFIFLSAGAEGGMVQMREVTLGLLTEDLMIDELVSLQPDAPLSAAAEALLRTDQRIFPVVGASGDLRGIVTRDIIAKAIAADGANAPIGEAMKREIPLMGRREHGDEAVRLLQQGAPAVGIVDTKGRLAGLVTWDNMLEFVTLAQAYRRSERREASPLDAPSSLRSWQ